MTRRRALSGALLLVIGLALVAAGVSVVLAVGPDDAVSSSPVVLRSSGVAVVVDDLGVGVGGVALPQSLGTLTVAVEGRGPAGVFVGTAPIASVAKYLAGSPYDVVVEVGGDGTATTTAVPGRRAVKPPRSVTLWRSRTVGASVPLDGRRVGAGALVVMNPDGSVGVDASLVATLRVPHARAVAGGLAVLGLLLVVLGVVVLVRGRRRGARAGAGGTGETSGAETTSPVGAQAPSPPVGAAAPVTATAEDAQVPGSGSDLARTGELVTSGAVTVDGPMTADPRDVRPETPESPSEAASGDSASAEPAAAADGAPVGRARDVVAATPVDEDLDPVFAELVAAYGGDPVHGTGEAAPAEAEASRAPDPARGGAGTPLDG